MDQNTRFSQGLQYAVNPDGKTCSVLGQGTCPDRNIIIPKVIDGCRVTGIQAKEETDYGPVSGFDTEVTGIVIPDSVTVIGTGAFSGCESLASITVPVSVQRIDSFAFFGCTSLSAIRYLGTKEQWLKITFDEHWKFHSAIFDVQCETPAVAPARNTSTRNGIPRVSRKAWELAKQNHVDVYAIVPSSPDGIIREDDVLRAMTSSEEK